MSVESVNNSNNNAGFYAAAGAIAGAGAGTSVAYLTKPFLKDGAPTDTFVKRALSNIVKTLEPKDKKMYDITQEISSLIQKASTKEELQDAIKNSSLLKQHNQVDVTLQQVKSLELPELKSIAEISKKFYLNSTEDLINVVWDKNVNKFVKKADIDEVSFNAIKKAARSIQGKYALIYAPIVAAVTGIGAYLIANSRKS